MEADIKTPTFSAIYESPELGCKIEMLVISYTNRIVFFISELNKLGAVVRCNIDTETKDFSVEEFASETEANLVTRVLLGNKADETLAMCGTVLTKLLNEHYAKSEGKRSMDTLCFISLKKRANQTEVLKYFFSKVSEDIPKFA
eukprot:TRINITY_DN3260_c0_g2_i1.p1 TRINITY_DN3260_c0_g2~~TRINITY_DN3260_c0_g2_i1.p1  ORF type:complete len:144 (-),score=36.88 TRINITY_DN3260_c0_g2_i1:130-561(-)